MPDPGSVMPSVPAGLRVRYALARAVFFLVYQLLGLRRRVIRDNLARSFPGRTPGELRRIRREFVARQSELLAELDYARVIGADELRARVRLHDPGGLLQGDGRLLLLTGHQCNFEWALLRISLEFGDSLIGLYKPMNGRWAERYVLGVRSKFGAQMLPSKSIRQELGRIRAARALGLVADQVPRTSPERHWTRFLHQHTAFFKGPERLARLLRAPIVYVSMRRLGRGSYEILFEQLSTPADRLPAGEATERFARTLERDIEADPAGWWWSHRRWKKLPAPRDGQRDD